MVIEESVRQICLWKHTAVADPNTHTRYSEAFWKYHELLPQRCPLDGTLDENTFGEVCSYKVIKELNVDRHVVESCVDSEFYDILQQQSTETAWSPTALRINGWRYAGTFTADPVAKAVCSSFVKPPPECAAIREAGLHGIHHLPGQHGIAWSTALLVFFLLVCVMLVIMMLYRRYLSHQLPAALRDEIQLSVKTEMAQYTTLVDEEPQNRRTAMF